MDFQLQLLKDSGLPDPQDLLGKTVKLEVDTGEVWTTIISLSTIANDDGYPELGVAPAYFRGDPIISVLLREDGRFFCRYKYWSNGVESSELSPCKLTLI